MTTNEQSTIHDVSDTALWVAAHRAAESARPDALYRDPLAAVLSGEKGRELARTMPYARMLAWIMAVRTVAIDRLILEAIAAGVDTVINLGAGLDTRPYRMDLPSGLKWIEVDFPHMVDLKNSKLAAEKPRCSLRRIGLDLSDRARAQRLYQELGAQTQKALIITEGVIPYLSVEQSGHLADDLRAVSSFEFWIQDYRNVYRGSWRPPRKMRARMRNAPMRFEHPDTLGFFAEHGWKSHHVIFAMDEGQRVGRPFPAPFPFNLIMRFLPAHKWDQARRSSGYVMFRRAD